jgi:hypothetical protein
MNDMGQPAVMQTDNRFPILTAVLSKMVKEGLFRTHKNQT